MDPLTNQTLTNKKVIILGGSSGIGLATAKAADAQGASVVIVSSNQQRIDGALKQLSANSTGLIADLSNEQQIKSLFEQIGKIDHLVYTAGENLQFALIADVSLADAQKYFNIRYWGAFMAIRYASPNFNVGGSITLTGGIAAVRPPAGWSLGASICAAMEGLTRAMAVELAPVRVNLVSPGLVNTDLWNNMADADKDALFTSIGNSLPVKRIGQAADIAKTYLYLMQQQYSTGQSLIVDGGNVLV